MKKFPDDKNYGITGRFYDSIPLEYEFPFINNIFTEFLSVSWIFVNHSKLA